VNGVNFVEGYVIRHDHSNGEVTGIYGPKLNESTLGEHRQLLRANGFKPFSSLAEARIAAKLILVADSNDEEITVYYLAMEIAESRDEARYLLDCPRFPIVFLLYNDEVKYNGRPEIRLFGTDIGAPQLGGDGYSPLEYNYYRPYTDSKRIQAGITNIGRQWESGFFPSTFVFEYREAIHWRIGGQGRFALPGEGSLWHGERTGRWYHCTRCGCPMDADDPIIDIIFDDEYGPYHQSC